jgi:hypothetical protein
MTCNWCQQEIQVPENHICPDGSTYIDRTEYHRKGKMSPFGAPSPNVLKLTQMDNQFLKGVKVKGD